jgi:DNA-binding cell septation regulator SpoVG
MHVTEVKIRMIDLVDGDFGKFLDKVLDTVLVVHEILQLFPVVCKLVRVQI